MQKFGRDIISYENKHSELYRSSGGCYKINILTSEDQSKASLPIILKINTIIFNHTHLSAIKN